jgi:hypothetical protein
MPRFMALVLSRYRAAPARCATGRGKDAAPARRTAKSKKNDDFSIFTMLDHLMSHHDC